MDDLQNIRLDELHRLTEADVVVDSDKREVELTILTAGPGNARNRHFYTPAMLEANHERYIGARMFKNHETNAERKSRGGLPRPVDELAGVIREAWWDPNWGTSGAVRGRAVLVDDKMVTIAKVAPELLGVSHDARGKSKPGTVAGQRWHMVEGIDEVKSVDLVTLAGARGQVDRILEAHMEDNMDPKDGPLRNVTLDDIREHAPHLLEAHAAELREAQVDTGASTNSDAVSADELREAVAEAVTASEERLRTEHAKELQLRDNRIVARNVLSESNLPEPSRAKLASEFHDAFYEATDGEDGTVITPEAQLREALQTAIKEKQEELAAATGSGSIRGMGSTQLTESGSGTKAPARKGGVHQQVVGQILRD